MQNNILIGAGFIVVGALLIVLGIRKKIKCSGRTVGRIIGVRESYETDDEGFNHYIYSPQFEYVVNGQITTEKEIKVTLKAIKSELAVISMCFTIPINLKSISQKAEGLFCHFWVL